MRAVLAALHKRDFPQVDIMRSGPRQLTLNVTERCDGRCLYCNLWKSGRDDPALSELLAVIKESAECGVALVRLSGGEPLLRSDLTQLVDSIKDRGMVSMVCTSARADTEKIKAVVNAGLDILSVSLDSLEPRVFYTLRGYNPEPVLRNLQALSTLRGKAFEIVISVVLTRQSLGGLGKLLDYIMEHDFVLNVTPLQVGLSGFNPRINELVFDEKDRLILNEAVLVIREAARKKLRIINGELYLAGIADFCAGREMPRGHACLTGVNSIIRTAGGEWKLCHSMEPLDGDSLATVWRSQEAKQMRSRMARLDCPLCWLSCHADEFRRSLPHRYGRQDIWEIL